MTQSSQKVSSSHGSAVNISGPVAGTFHHSKETAVVQQTACTPKMARNRPQIPIPDIPAKGVKIGKQKGAFLSIISLDSSEIIQPYQTLLLRLLVYLLSLFDSSFTVHVLEGCTTEKAQLKLSLGHAENSERRIKSL